MDRKDFYFKQPVTEAELNGAFDDVEWALWHLTTDMGMVGICSGMIGAETAPTPSMSVTISGPGFAYDGQGERIFVAAPWAPQPNGLDLTLDSNLVPTAVTAGNERWVGVFVKFQRSLSDPRIDGGSSSIFFESDEGYKFVVVSGGQASIVSGAAPRMAPDPSMLLLFEVHIIHGQTSIRNADIHTEFRQDTFAITQTPISLRAGTLRTGLVAILQALNNHITGVGGFHPDTAITSIARAGAPLALGAGSVGSQLQAILAYIDGPLQTALAGLVFGGTLPDTAITSPARGGTPLALGAGSVGSQLQAILAYLDAASRSAYAASIPWPPVADFGDDPAGTYLLGAQCIFTAPTAGFAVAIADFQVTSWDYASAPQTTSVTVGIATTSPPTSHPTAPCNLRTRNLILPPQTPIDADHKAQRSTTLMARQAMTAGQTLPFMALVAADYVYPANTFDFDCDIVVLFFGT